jgi:hypothetical protein
MKHIILLGDSIFDNKEGIPLIDLRLVCSEGADYANEIEPSIEGGRKIAASIVRLVNEHNFGSRRTEAFI